MRKILFSITLFYISICAIDGHAQNSIARDWNEVLLEAIRNDFARPTVHARNLFHTSVVMYDAWAAYDDSASTLFLGKEMNGFPVPFNGVEAPLDPLLLKKYREEAISYAAYRLLIHRFENSPGASHSLFLMDSLFSDMGYDKNKTSWNYATGDPAALGNYIAAYMINYGQQDGANEINGYTNRYYEPVNPALDLGAPGNPDLIDPNRWQPLKFDTFVDQSGNLYLGGTPACLSPEWGSVEAFSLTEDDLEILQRDGEEWWVYHNPGHPPYLDTVNGAGDSDLYKWTFELVSAWSSHMDPDDTTMWDISPNHIGNIPIELYPDSFSEYPSFYDFENGGDISLGYDVNPATGLPYPPQIKKRGDYARVLAEFWADGPDSETPPGHWFTILNAVMDYPEFNFRYKGEGEELDHLEYQVKAYLTLGGAMHDVAITSWGVKGYYDYIRPISALRYMAKLGQSSDPNLPNYHPAGIQLIPGFIEQIQVGDSLAGNNNQFVGKIKVKAWRGHNFISNAETDIAHVGWILARNWWPYQRPSFVTPPFPGFVSGHSTYSRAAAEVMTMLTGDEYFPGGVGRFVAPKNDFLVFEKGPSDTIVLEWAKYYDASDQCSLSRIWGGIHPPADDIKGRKMGRIVGIEAFNYAEAIFRGDLDTATGVNDVISLRKNGIVAYPNPSINGQFNIKLDQACGEQVDFVVYDTFGRLVLKESISNDCKSTVYGVDLTNQSKGVYLLAAIGENLKMSQRLIIQ
jgi:hypothetical protein